MKKIFLFATMVAATAFASCSKNTEIINNQISADAPQVKITLGSEEQTRAFFDNAANAETWENELKTMSIYAFDAGGKFIVKRTLSASEVAAKSASFGLPNSAAGTNCSFYVVANADYGNVATTAAMDALTESVALAEYNGTFAQTAQARKRTAGFVMTGTANVKVAAAGSSTTVPVTLRRTVAKIAVRTRMDAAFATSYNGGRVTISSIKLAKASSVSNSFYKSGSYAARTTLYETTQTPQKTGDSFDGCFYAYENATLATGSRVALILTGYFDADGNDSTTTDRLNVEYTVELSGAGSGEIKRNGYYRVDAVIKGLSGNAVAAVVTVAAWETPITQTINLGN